MAGMALLYTDTTRTSYIHYAYSIHHTHTHTHTLHTHTHTHYIHYTNYILSFMGVNTLLLLLLITLLLKVLNPSCCNVLKIKTVMCKTINVKVFSSWQKPISPNGWWKLKGTCPSYDPSLYTVNTHIDIQFIYVLHSLIIIYKITYKCFR